MKRARNKVAVPRLTREAERIVSMSHGLGASGSRIEDRYWQEHLHREIERLLAHGSDASLEAALDHLFATLPPAYEALIEELENSAESSDEELNSALLVAVPIVAWSKYSIASGPIKADLVHECAALIQAHLVLPAVRVRVVPYLFSVDQLPNGLSKTRGMLDDLVADDKAGRAAHFDTHGLPETAPLLADSRFLVAALIAPRGTAMFRWQEMGQGAKPLTNREQILDRWRHQFMPLVATLLSGCVFEVLLPDGFHVALREADHAVRPYSIDAAVAFLTRALSHEPQQLHATVAPVGPERAEEFRIGFTVRGQTEVVHGVVWPLLSPEESIDAVAAQEQICALIRKNGVGEVLALDRLCAPEYCEDCGAPLFPDPSGELVHAELPEELEPSHAHLH
jgi:hypothetical protein